jgi:GTP-binding protein
VAITAEFVLSAASAKQFPTDNLPEIALVGRSNVGKSSMINSLLKMNKLARTSSTPGRTQTLNFYRVWPEGRPKGVENPVSEGEERFWLRGALKEAALTQGAFYFVDMPGYGFAKVSAAQRNAWQKLITDYLLSRPNLRAVIQIVDFRHPPTKDDVAMYEWLRHYEKVRLCLATKVDKVGRSQWVAHTKEITRGLGMKFHLPLGPDTPVDPHLEPLHLYSAETGHGRDDLWRWVERVARS